MRLVVMADTHGKHREMPRERVPAGDVLLHGGDFLGENTISELEDFNRWLGSLPYEHIVLIAGNHDGILEQPDLRDRALSRLTNAVYLEDRGVTIQGIRIWGAPWTPEFMNWHFMLPRGEALREKWDRIPGDTDVLLTHGPPRGHGDGVVPGGEHVGCEELLRALRRVEPLLHCFGHIHEARGVTEVGSTVCANCSVLNHRYEAAHPPTVFELDEETGEVTRML